MPTEVMNKISDLVEEELTNKGIPYMVEGTKFILPMDLIPYQLEAQRNATIKLINDGVITPEMIKKEIETFPELFQQ